MLDSLEGCVNDCLLVQGLDTKIENHQNSIQNNLNKLKRKREEKCEEGGKEEEIIKENNLFLADPFLALQNDLDDVSG